MQTLPISQRDIVPFGHVTGLAKRSLPPSKLPTKVTASPKERYDPLEAEEIAKLKPLGDLASRLAYVTEKWEPIFISSRKPSPTLFTSVNPPKAADFDLRQVSISVVADSDATRTIICYVGKERARRAAYKDRDATAYDARGYGSANLDALKAGYAWFESLGKVAMAFQALEARLVELRGHLQRDPKQEDRSWGDRYRIPLHLTPGERQMLMDHPMFRKVQKPRQGDLTSVLVEVVPAQFSRKGPDDLHDFRVNLAYMDSLFKTGFYDKAA